MTNREMLDKYKGLICLKLNKLNENSGNYGCTPDVLVRIGEALEKYMWMDIQLEEDRQDKGRETE